MAGQFKSVRVIANANNKTYRTVNIVTSQPANDAHHYPQYAQVTLATVNANPPGTFETVQDSGGTVAGLKTVYIPGYTAPN